MCHLRDGGYAAFTRAGQFGLDSTLERDGTSLSVWRSRSLDCRSGKSRHLRELPVRSQYGSIGPVQFSRQGERSGNIGAGGQPELRLPVSGDGRQRDGPANPTSSSRRSGRFLCPEGTYATSGAVGIGKLPRGGRTNLISASGARCTATYSLGYRQPIGRGAGPSLNQRRGSQTSGRPHFRRRRTKTSAEHSVKIGEITEPGCTCNSCDRPGGAPPIPEHKSGSDKLLFESKLRK